MGDINDLTQNVNIWDDAKSKSVTVTTDSSNERLDIKTEFEYDSEGNKRKLKVTDANVYILLKAILKQLKIMNAHLGIISDEQIDEEEVE